MSYTATVKKEDDSEEEYSNMAPSNFSKSLEAQHKCLEIIKDLTGTNKILTEVNRQKDKQISSLRATVSGLQNKITGLKKQNELLSGVIDGQTRVDEFNPALLITPPDLPNRTQSEGASMLNPPRKPMD